MKILCVIPSRIGSTRLLRKPLLSIQGKPMVQMVYENAKKCSVISEVVVATDHEDIVDIINCCGGKAILTSPDIPTGSDRVAMVAKQYPEMEVVINLQGDEPFVQAQMLEQLIMPYLKGEWPDMTTLAYPLDMQTEYNNPDIVKVIVDINHDAIYFSRSPIPYLRHSTNILVYHHLGLYAFTRDFLLAYNSLPQSSLEKAEALEQLRALEHGYKIRVCLTDKKTLEINTEEEFQQAQNFFHQVET